MEILQLDQISCLSGIYDKVNLLLAAKQPCFHGIFSEEKT